jgi:PadR family transcriptional regulator, regulatory protein PadR
VAPVNPAPRMTAQTLKLVRLFAADPDAARYGLDLAKQAGLKHGTTYPILKRLLAAGWLESRPEDVDPSEEGRPRQRLYRLTRLGEAEALRVLGEHHITLPERRPSRQPRMPWLPQPGGATT